MKTLTTSAKRLAAVAGSTVIAFDLSERFLIALDMLNLAGGICSG